MECKSINRYICIGCFEELIETLWNVNVFAPVIRFAPAQELIETLWNVNKLELTTLLTNLAN